MRQLLGRTLNTLELSGYGPKPKTNGDPSQNTQTTDQDNPSLIQVKSEPFSCPVSELTDTANCNWRK